MKSMILIASMIIKLIQCNDGFAAKICVKSPFGWLSSLDGGWQYEGMVNDHPAYTQISCTTKPNECNIKRTLSVKNNYYIFTDENGKEGAYCMDDNKHHLTGIDRPELCPAWWGGTIVRDCNKQTTLSPEIKSVDYNLINPYPECFYGKDQDHFCNEMYSQTENQQDLTHPNYEERLTATLINMARLFPEEYRTNSKYGGSKFNYYTGCGKDHAQKVPLFYSSKANEAARFHNYDQLNCAQGTGHTTCPTRCDLFTEYTNSKSDKCSAYARWKAFSEMKPDDGMWMSGGEGICGYNGCYTDGHCWALFKPANEFIGIGKWKGGHHYDAVYGTFGINKAPKKYPIVYGAHLDGRYYFGNFQSSSNQITFLLQWYGVAYNNARANSVHLIFEDDEHTMTRLYGDDLSGFYEIEMTMNSDDNKHFCEPYAFIVEASDGNTYRLPENDRYFFATAFFDSYGQAPLYECNENHYYKNDNNQWIANGGPLNLITSNNECIGCSKASKLASLN